VFGGDGRHPAPTAGHLENRGTRNHGGLFSG
jgi:hypothetical protein